VTSPKTRAPVDVNGLHLGARQLRPGEQAPLLDHVRHLALGLGLLVHVTPVQNLGGFRQLARERLLDRRPFVEQSELEERRLADQRLGPRRVLHARQLDQDPLAALTGDRRLGYAELVDAVADRLQPLADRVVT